MRSALVRIHKERWVPRNEIEIVHHCEKVINARFREAGIGFALDEFQIIKVADQHLHETAVVPALKILQDSDYANVNAEYRLAFDHYKAGSFEDALTNAAKALESMLKVLSAKLGWGTQDTDPLARLLDAMFASGFVQPYMKDSFTGLRQNLLSAGVVRNKDGAHGSGEKPRLVPIHLVEYQLNLTASAIVYLHRQAVA